MPFTDRQIALLQNFAAQAVIAMENARLINETREALEQQTATTEVLQVINSSPGDLAPVFDAMLEKALRLCDAAFGVLWTGDGESYRAAALRGVPPAYAEFVTREPRGRQSGGALGRLLGGEPLVHIPDTAASTPDEMGRTLDALGGIRTLLAIPLRKEGTVLGAFTIYRQEVRPFSDKQIALLQNFAAQAVIAMENARLLTETREALEQQTATAEVLQVINSSPGDLAPVFDAMLEKAMRLCDAAFGVMLKYDGGRFYPLALREVPPAYSELLLREPLRFAPDTALGRIEAGEDVISSTDARVEYSQASALIRTLQELGGIRSVVFVSLRKDGALLGVLVAYRQEPRAFSDKEIPLLQNFAAQAVIAMENARLLGELRERTHDLEESLEYQTATSNVLEVINSSPGDLVPVFDAILEQAHALCGAPLGSLVLRDGEQLRAVATRGYPRRYEELARQGFSPTPPFLRMLSGEPFLSCPRRCGATDRSGRSSNAARRRRDRRNPHRAVRAVAQGCNGARLYQRPAAGGAPILRQANRAAAELRRAGGDRDGERSAVDRDARGAGAADRDRRGVAGHQFLTRRSRAGIRRDFGESA
jgi:GAF domain-containing protein